MTVEKNAQVVLITGCSSGIGFTLSLLLAREAHARFKVYASMRNLAKKGALEKEAGRLLGKTLVIKQLDVSVEEQIDDLVEDIIETEGKIDVLVNNAGFGMFGPIETLSVAKTKEMFATNVYGPICLTQKVLPLWKKNGPGHVVMVSSVGGIVGIPFNGAYCASKSALEGFSEALVLECRNYDIRVSIIEPGPVTTNFDEHIKPDDSNIENVDEETQKLVQKVAENTTNSSTTMSQTPEDVAKHILNAIKSAEPKVRYLTNNIYSTAVQRKLADPTGNDVLQMALS